MKALRNQGFHILFPYCCDVDCVTTINYGRMFTRTAPGRRNQQADETSAKIVLRLVTSENYVGRGSCAAHAKTGDALASTAGFTVFCFS